MTELDSRSQPAASPNALPQATSQLLKPGNSFYHGPNGFRAGWRWLIFFVLFQVIASGLALIRLVGPEKLPIGHIFSDFSPFSVLFGEALNFAACLLATWIMSRIELRRIADYGLPARGGFRSNFWWGALVGFSSITLLLLSLRFAGVFQFGPLALHGADILKYALLWGAAFFFGGLQEEFTVRGYSLFTFTTGMGFWPAALLTSVFFAAGHYANPGENAVGIVATGAIAIFFCVLVWRTGDLWAAIGFHAAWDWGLTFFYGVPDSGLNAPGHLLQPMFFGPDWLTGGAAGPEGSWFCLLLIALLTGAALFCLPQVKYPNPAAVPDQRRLSAESIAPLFPSASASSDGNSIP